MTMKGVIYTDEREQGRGLLLREKKRGGEVFENASVHKVFSLWKIFRWIPAFAGMTEIL